MEEEFGESVFCSDLRGFDDAWLIGQFRFPWGIILELCTGLAPAFQKETGRTEGSGLSSGSAGVLQNQRIVGELADRSDN